MPSPFITNMDDNSKKRIRLIFNPKDHFPAKLYDVCNDGHLVKWNRNGSISVIDEEAFEKQVMDLYPGFLQIPNFLNFRRLFREYGFEWVINQDDILEFSHPLFVRGRRQLLPDIRTRRKSFHSTARPTTESSDIIETDPDKRYSTRKRRRTKHFNTKDDSAQSVDIQAGGEGNISVPNLNTSAFVQTPLSQNGFRIAPPPKVQKPEVKREDTRIIQQNFVQNELTEEEFMHWIARQRKIERPKEETPQTVSKDFVWMYYDNNGARPEFVSNNDGQLVLTPTVKKEPMDNNDEKPVTGIPCGMCKCCVAMSLLSAENSLTDESFMVDLDSDVEVSEIIVEENNTASPSRA